MLSLPELTAGPAPGALRSGAVVLMVSEGKIMLQLTGPGAPGPVSVTFDDPALLHRRRAGHNELLGRAVGCKQDHAPRVLDATAGFGRDAFVLADLGCHVTLCEREPVMAALLEFALESARQSGDSRIARVTQRMALRALDARQLADGECDADVIYMDPMFAPERKSAPAKAMQVLQLLAGEKDGDSAEKDAVSLLSWARCQPAQRVVLKRPRRAPQLGDVAPGHSLRGRSVRFDVYPLPRTRSTGTEVGEGQER